MAQRQHEAASSPTLIDHGLLIHLARLNVCTPGPLSMEGGGWREASSSSTKRFALLKLRLSQSTPQSYAMPDSHDLLL